MRGQTGRHAWRSFVYVSDAKLKGFLAQIDDRARQNILDKLQPSFGFNITPFSLSVQPKSAHKSVRDRSQAVQVAMVEEIIQEQFHIGDLATGDHWIAGRVDMDLEPLADAETVLFCGYAGPLLVALSGSVGHLTEHESPGPRMGSYSYAVRAAILDGNAPGNLGERLASAAQGMNFAPRPVRFLAQVIKRGQLEEGRQREFILATPLYVEDAHLTDDVPVQGTVQGTVRWVSADQSWGLISPDAEKDAVVFDRSTTPEGNLVSGQRVEFRVTHGTAGILASSVRTLDDPPGLVARGQPLDAGDPEWIGGYEVLRRLGEGSMGMVYLARGEDGRLAAIKVIRPEFGRSPEFLRRFQAEAGHAGRVSGPNLARVIAAVTDNEQQPYLVTEFVAGPTLEEQVERHGPLPARSAIDAAAGVAAALEVIHRAGIVHRDLTPANVILSSSGPVVIDFGIAHAPGSGTRLTQVGWPIGTPAYNVARAN